MTDASLRHAALFAVQRLWRRFGDADPFRAIDEGFLHEGERIPFLSVWEGVLQARPGSPRARSRCTRRYISRVFRSKASEDRIAVMLQFRDVEALDSGLWKGEVRDRGAVEVRKQGTVPSVEAAVRGSVMKEEGAHLNQPAEVKAALAEFRAGLREIGST